MKTVIISDIVESLNETVVKELKAAASDGKITKDEGQEILASAIELVKSQLSQEVQTKISLIVGDIDLWIESVIEVLVKEKKR